MRTACWRRLPLRPAPRCRWVFSTRRVMAVRARRCPNPLRVADLNGVLSERCDNDPRYNTSSASCVIVYRTVELSLSGGEPLAPPPPPPPPHGPDPTPPNPMTPSSRWRVEPMTVKITHDRRAPFDSSATDVDVAAQRGECERVQLCKQYQDLSLRAHPARHVVSACCGQGAGRVPS